MTNFLRCRCRTVAAAAALTAVFAGLGNVESARASDWPILAGGVTRSGVSDEAVKTPLSLLWRYTGAPQSGNPCAPVVAGNTVYYAARGAVNGAGTLFAVDTMTGALRWRFDLQGNNLFQTAPTVANGSVYIGASNGSVYVLDAASGHEVHAPFQTSRSVAAAPTVVDNVLYFGSDDGNFYAFQTDTTTAAWKVPFKAGDAINSAPVIAGGFVYFTTVGNTVFGVKQSTGIGRWSFHIPYRVLSNAPVFADNILYVPASQRLYAFLPTSGNVRWARDFPNDIVSAPATEDGIIYCLAKNQKGDGAQLWAVRSNNGKNYWTKPADIDLTPSAAPTISGGIIFVPTLKNMLYALSKEDGHVLWQYKIDPTASAPNTVLPAATALTVPVTVSNGALYALTDDGSLSAFRPDAPDATGPIVSSTYPDSAQRVNGSPPFTLAAFIVDAGSGIDPASVKLKLDGKDQTTDFDADRGLAYYQTKSTTTGVVERAGLSQGRHTAILTATDWRGNITSQEWSFVIDNTVAPATRTGEAPVTRTANGRKSPPTANTGTGTGRPYGNGGARNGGGRGGNGGGRRGGVVGRGGAGL